MFKEIAMLIAPSCGGHLRQARREMGQIRHTTTAEERFDERKATSSSADNPAIWLAPGLVRSNFVVARLDETENHAQQPVGIWEMSAQLAKT
jgi:hypothetical protein